MQLARTCSAYMCPLFGYCLVRFAAVAVPCFRSYAAMTTVARTDASASEVALPMPVSPPVITTTEPLMSWPAATSTDLPKHALGGTGMDGNELGPGGVACGHHVAIAWVLQIPVQAISDSHWLMDGHCCGAWLAQVPPPLKKQHAPLPLTPFLAPFTTGEDTPRSAPGAATWTSSSGSTLRWLWGITRLWRPPTAPRT